MELISNSSISIKNEILPRKKKECKLHLIYFSFYKIFSNLSLPFKKGFELRKGKEFLQKYSLLTAEDIKNTMFYAFDEKIKINSFYNFTLQFDEIHKNYLTSKECIYEAKTIEEGKKIIQMNVGKDFLIHYTGKVGFEEKQCRK